MKKYIYIIIAAVAIILLSCKTSTPKAEIYKIENLIVHQKYREAERECAKILYSESKEYNEESRLLVANYLRLCLLKSGNLNNNFYSYSGKIQEMLYPLPRNHKEDVASLAFAFECAIPFVSEDVDVFVSMGQEKSPVFWNIFEKWAIINNQKRHYQALRNYAMPDIPKMQIDSVKLMREFLNKTITTPPDAKAQTADFPISIFNVFQIRKNDKEVLEAHTAMILFVRQLSALPEVVERYSKLGYARLPAYVQEAAIIFLQNPNINYYYGFEIEERIKRRQKEFIAAINSIEYGLDTPESIKERFNDTYSCYYYLLQSSEI